MKSFLHLLRLAAMILLLVSCSTPGKNLFVLVSDPDGKTGEITVSNKAGTQAVAKPGHVTEVKDAHTAPVPPEPMDEKEIKRIFGAALAAQPQSPVTYILYFEKGSTNLTKESEQLLPTIIATIKERKSSDIAVVGHSDRVGTRQKNYELSFDRAQRIKDVLVSKGASLRDVEIDSHGEDNPLVKTADEVPEPRNRRVEVTVR
jgi:outer membrane protein OmpA-like peptidoglycan-associated protein